MSRRWRMASWVVGSCGVVRRGDRDIPRTGCATPGKAPAACFWSRPMPGNPLKLHETAIAVAQVPGAQRLFYTSQVSGSVGSHFPPGSDHAATEAMPAASGLSCAKGPDGSRCLAAGRTRHFRRRHLAADRERGTRSCGSRVHGERDDRPDDRPPGHRRRRHGKPRIFRTAFRRSSWVAIARPGQVNSRRSICRPNACRAVRRFRCAKFRVRR